VVLVTFHGAPLHAHALHAGVQALARRGVRAIQPHNLLMRLLMRVDGAAFPEAFAHIEDPDERAAMMRDMPLDFHAGVGETSVALHYAPESVSPRYTSLAPCPTIQPDPAFVLASRAARAAGRHELAIELHFAAYGRGWTNLRPFPGYTGRPHRATPGVGAFLAHRIVDDYADAARAVFAGADGPAPIMSWIVKATLGGVIPSANVRIAEVARFSALDAAPA
jgi:hypothetical protein